MKIRNGHQDARQMDDLANCSVWGEFRFTEVPILREFRFTEVPVLREFRFTEVPVWREFRFTEVPVLRGSNEQHTQRDKRSI